MPHIGYVAKFSTEMGILLHLLYWSYILYCTDPNFILFENPISFCNKLSLVISGRKILNKYMKMIGTSSLNVSVVSLKRSQAFCFLSSALNMENVFLVRCF